MIQTNSIAKTEPEFLTQVIRASWAVLGVCIVYQLIFFAEIINVVAMASVVLAWFVSTNIWLRKSMLETYLISAFTILGFASTQFYFPLVFTTIENKPLIYNLELPEEVFLHSSLALFVLIIAHAIYRFISKISFSRSVSLLGKIGFFDPPSHMQLWLMGFFGMASSFYVYFTSPDIGREVTGAASDKLLQGLVPFSYAPFFIPLGKLFGNNQKLSKTFVLTILIYSAMLFAISVGRNSRAGFILGLTTPAFAYALGLLLGVFKTKILTFKNVAVGAFVLYILTGPLSDLGVAMLIARDKNNKDITAMEQIDKTLEAFGDDYALEARRKSDLANDAGDFDWDERYLDNLFTARFANIKFNDASLVTYSKVGPYDPDMQDFSRDQLVATLPDPIIKLFGFDVDKEVILSLSFGDYLYLLAGGYGQPEGFRIGHIAGTGLAAYGWWYLWLFGLVVIPIFYLNDKFFRRKTGLALSSAERPEQKFLFSFCGVLALTSFFQFLMFESVIIGANYLIRGWIQIVVLYFLMFHASRLLSQIIEGRKKTVARVSN